MDEELYLAKQKSEVESSGGPLASVLTADQRAVQRLDWQRLLIEALTVPGRMSDTYCRFYNYSLLNQLLIYLQGVREPVNTYDRWKAMGRQVVRGSRAKAIVRPLIARRTDETGEDQQVLRGFKLVHCLFGVSETTGDELPPFETRDWHLKRALGALAITEQPFADINGNIQGYSWERNIAISPVAKHPLKTALHEIAHIEHGHTAEESSQEALHRGIAEFQAESTALVVANEIGAAAELDTAESRAYVQHWLGTEPPSQESVRAVFRVSERLIRAGRDTARLADGQ